MGCSWAMHNVTWYLHPHYDMQNAELYNWNVNLKPNRKYEQYHIIQHTSMTTPTFVYVCLLETAFLITWIAAIIYMINRVYGSEILGPVGQILTLWWSQNVLKLWFSHIICNPIRTWCVHLLGQCSELSRFWAMLATFWPSYRVSVQNWFAFGPHWLYFLHSTSVPLFYIDVVVTLSTMILTHWAAHRHMARQCRACLPWRHQVATHARSVYLASTTTWRQKHWSHTPRHTLKYRTFLFVDIAEIGTVSVLSSYQNEAYIGCRLIPETLTWPDPANLA